MSDPEYLKKYKTVAERIAEFRELFPEGSLQPADLEHPYRIESVGRDVLVTYVAAAYRNPGDQRPGIGCAQERYPGGSRFTAGSELQNVETSAWGRAIVAALATDTTSGIASREEVRNAAATRERGFTPPADVRTPRPVAVEIFNAIVAASTAEQLKAAWEQAAQSGLTDAEAAQLRAHWDKRHAEILEVGHAS